MYHSRQGGKAFFTVFGRQLQHISRDFFVSLTGDFTYDAIVFVITTQKIHYERGNSYERL
jgi:hypothetical protein